MSKHSSTDNNVANDKLYSPHLANGKMRLDIAALDQITNFEKHFKKYG